MQKFNHELLRMKTVSKFSRRDWLKTTAVFGAAATLPQLSRSQDEPLYKVSKGRVNQSVVSWCFKPMTVDELAATATKLGLKSLELVQPEHFATIKKHGLTCAIVSSHGFAKGFAHRDQHEECLKNLRERIDAAAEAGFPSVITFSGFRKGLSDE